MDNIPQDKVETSQEVQNTSRRRLLKFLAAGGAVTAVSMLPGKWSSPSIKTGVLPAHAQVTPPPTATPVPDIFEVRCEPEFDTGEDDLGVIYYLAATAWNVTKNLAAAGIELTATIILSQSSVVGTATTDAQGVASFVLTVPYNEFPTGATVTFSDQTTYGTDSCTIDLRIPD